MSIIEVSHLTKEYKLGEAFSLKDNAIKMAKFLVGKGESKKPRFKALDDLSFTVETGEVVGIIGHNGAGKSTLLKHLAKISKPSKGKVAVRGCILI